MGLIEDVLNRPDEPMKVEVRAGIKCKYCERLFVPVEGHQKYCSKKCRREVAGSKARRGMRNRRIKKVNGKCQVCGYKETLDIHHEGKDVYVLCPNHHALITRGITQIEEYKIKPI